MTVRRVLFVTWDGPEQAYLESLFLPVFAELGRLGVSVDVLQWTYAGAAAAARTREAGALVGLRVDTRTALRRAGPGGVAVSVAAGIRELQARAASYDRVLARSILPALMALGSPAARKRLVFDADGLSADERVEFAGWRPQGVAYTLYREIERRALEASLAVVTRTEAARQILLARAPGCPPRKLHVVPNGSDSERFRPASGAERLELRGRLGVAPEAPWVLSVGSQGPQYLPALQGALLRALRAALPAVRCTVLTGAPERVPEELRGAIGPALEVRSVPPAEVAAWLGAADLGLATRAPSFSQCAVAPIKVGEYLLSGLPVILTAGVGDLDSLAAGGGLAVHRLREPFAEAVPEAVEWFRGEVLPRRDAARHEARTLGLERFTVEQNALGLLRALWYPEAPPVRAMPPGP